MNTGGRRLWPTARLLAGLMTVGSATSMAACGSTTASSPDGGATSDAAVVDSTVDGAMVDGPRSETGPSDGASATDASSADSGIVEAGANESSVPALDTGAPGSERAKVVAEHALAQVGFAIAMASTVLQTQIHVLFGGLLYGTLEAGTCLPLLGGGSTQAAPSSLPLKPYNAFYDSNCTQHYIDVAIDFGNLVVDAGPSDAAPDGPTTFGETLAYHGLDGGNLGVLALNQSVWVPLSDAGSLDTYLAYGTGTFAPASGAASVQLGLSCRIGFQSGGVACAGGVAQDFPALSIALGSVTPLVLTTLDGGSPFGLVLGQAGGVAFSGTGSMVVAGPLGSLTLGTPVAPALAIDGGTPYASADTQGGAAALSFFPPTPTAWTITDSAHDEQFQITLLDDTTRNLAAKVTQISSGATLATATLDQSGTGTITYSDGSSAAVTSWTLAD